MARLRHLNHLRHTGSSTKLALSDRSASFDSGLGSSVDRSPHDVTASDESDNTNYSNNNNSSNNSNGSLGAGFFATFYARTFLATNDSEENLQHQQKSSRTPPTSNPPLQFSFPPLSHSSSSYSSTPASRPQVFPSSDDDSLLTSPDHFGDVTTPVSDVTIRLLKPNATTEEVSSLLLLPSLPSAAASGGNGAGNYYSELVPICAATTPRAYSAPPESSSSSPPLPEHLDNFGDVANTVLQLIKRNKKKNNNTTVTTSKKTTTDKRNNDRSNKENRPSSRSSRQRVDGFDEKWHSGHADSDGDDCPHCREFERANRSKVDTMGGAESFVNWIFSKWSKVSGR
jgi:hypothetical protein